MADAKHFQRIDDFTSLLTCPVRVKVVITVDTPGGEVEVFEERSLPLFPGDVLTWRYPEDGLKVTIT